MRSTNKQPGKLSFFSFSNIVKLFSIVQTGYSNTYRFLDNLLYPLRWLGSLLNWLFECLVAGTVGLFAMCLYEFYKFGVAFLKMSYVATYTIGSIIASLPHKEEIEADYKYLKNIEDAMEPLLDPFVALSSFIVSSQKLISNLTGLVLASVCSMALHIPTIPGTALYLSAVLIKEITQGIASGIISGYILCASMINALVKPDNRTALQVARQRRKLNKAPAVEESQLDKYQPRTEDQPINLLKIEEYDESRTELFQQVQYRFLFSQLDRLVSYNSRQPVDRKLTFTNNTDGTADTSQENTRNLIKFLKNHSLMVIRRNDARKWIEEKLLPTLDEATDEQVIESVCKAITSIGGEVELSLDGLKQRNMNTNEQKPKMKICAEAIIAAHGGHTAASGIRESLYNWCNNLLSGQDNKVTEYPMPGFDDQPDSDHLDSSGLRVMLLTELIDIIWTNIIASIVSNRDHTDSETMSQTQYSPGVSAAGTPVRASQLQRRLAAVNEDDQDRHNSSGPLKAAGWLSSAASLLGWNQELSNTA